MNAACERFVLGALAGLAVHALCAFAALALRCAVPAWLLPGALLLGCCVTWRLQPLPAVRPPRRWLCFAVLAVLAAALVAVGYGALSTPSRHWDGAVAWDTTARFLADGLTLEQPYFRDPAVLAHSRDYPLLQPLLLATVAQLGAGNVGRAVFPLLYMLLGLLVWTSLRRVGGDADVPWLGAAAVLLTPVLASPTSGGIDSGYGDAFLLVATTAMAAGLLHKDVRLLACGAVIAVAVKPEGLVYAGAATAVAFCAGERRLLLAAAGGWLLAAAAWLPVQRRLLAPDAGASGVWIVVGAAFAFAAIAGADAAARRFSLGRRGRAFGGCVLLLAFAGVLHVLAAGLPGDGGALQAYVAEPLRLLQRLDRLPAIVAGVANHGLLRGGSGAAFWFVLLAAPAIWRQRATLAPLAGFVLVGLAIVPLPFLLGPEPDLQHQLRSSLPRLLLHWLGPGLLLASAALARCGFDSAEAEPHREAAAQP